MAYLARYERNEDDEQHLRHSKRQSTNTALNLGCFHMQWRLHVNRSTMMTRQCIQEAALVAS